MTALIFDIDGTLTDTTTVDDKCFIQAFNSVFGIDISNQNWSEIKNVTDWGIAQEIIYKNRKRLPIKSELEELELEFLRLLENELLLDKSQFREIDGATKFISQLSKIPDTMIGLATGGWQRSATLKLKAIGLNINDYPFSTSSQFMEREKILTDTINQITELAEKPLRQIIYFGDGIWDFTTCKNLRIRFVGIDNKENGKLKKIGAQEVFKDFNQPELINACIYNS